MKLKTLDLFSGIGGFARGLEATDFFETSCFIENEPYCQAVLKYHWPDVPVLGDITNVRKSDLPDPNPDVICGGFPCQPFSHAGKQQAQDDSRHLWPEMFRLIRECRPTWVVGENVAGIINLGLDEVLADLESEGYATRTFNIPACAVGAPHIRQRIWVVAHADSESEPDGAFDGNAGQRQLGFGFMADPDSQRSQGQWPDGSEEGREDSERQAGLCGGAVLADSERTGTGMEKHRSGGQGRKSPDAPQSEVLRQEDGTDCSKGTTAGGRNVADTERKGERRRRVSGPGKDKGENGKGLSGEFGGCSEAMADSDGNDGGRGGSTKSSGRNPRMEYGGGGSSYVRPEEWWAVEPSVGRLVDGLPNRVSQLRALGNSIVPQIAEEIGKAIKRAEQWKP